VQLPSALRTSLLLLLLLVVVVWMVRLQLVVVLLLLLLSWVRQRLQCCVCRLRSL
jgi:hypothetical protein